MTPVQIRKELIMGLAMASGFAAMTKTDADNRVIGALLRAATDDVLYGKLLAVIEEAQGRTI